MKGLVAKKLAKMMKNGIELADSDGLKEADKFVRTSHKEKAYQVISRTYYECYFAYSKL